MDETKSADPIEVAWAAGLFEGEGSIHLNHKDSGRHKRVYIRMNLSSNDEDVARRFAATVGVGRVYGPYLDKNAKNPRWSWHARSRSDVAHVLALLEPFLCSRRTAKLAELRVIVANQRPLITSGWKLSPEHCAQISERMKQTWAERKARAEAARC